MSLLTSNLNFNSLKPAGNRIRGQPWSQKKWTAIRMGNASSIDLLGLIKRGGQLPKLQALLKIKITSLRPENRSFHRGKIQGLLDEIIAIAILLI